MASTSIPPVPIGWPLLPVPDNNGELSYPTLDQSVRQTIQVLFRTRPGEQLMHPAFGAGLQNYLNEPNTLTTRRRIRDAVTEALADWEPRIIVDHIEILEVPNFPTQLRVDLAYRVRRTGVAQRLGMTLDVGS
jgi:phage baseplate assembly protein W